MGILASLGVVLVASLSAILFQVNTLGLMGTRATEVTRGTKPAPCHFVSNKMVKAYWPTSQCLPSHLLFPEFINIFNTSLDRPYTSLHYCEQSRTAS